MITIRDDNKTECVGCGACMQACPAHCITMQSDAEGFLYPVVSMQDCLQCGKCEQVCPLHYPFSDTDSLAPPVSYGGYHTDDGIREQSSSGGIFTLFADDHLKRGGIVCGCRLDDQMKAVHVCVDHASGLNALQGSKYVQSDLNTVYTQIRDHLSAARPVLFVGTPCQCAGLKSFLGKEYENLLLVDFICHGVPSPSVFESYIRYLEENAGSKVVSFRFRNKDKGWQASGLELGRAVSYADGHTDRNYPAFHDPFMNGFLSDLCLRPACHACAFKKIPKLTADITIADFWGIDKVAPALNDGKGTSLLLIHSEKGRKAFETVKENMVCEEVPFQKALRRNQSLFRSAVPHFSRNKFFNTLQNRGFQTAKRKYLSAFFWAFCRGMRMIWSLLEKTARIVLSPILTRIYPKWDEKNWEEFFRFVKFAMIGVSNACVSYTVYLTCLFLLKPLHWNYDYMAGNTMGFLISVLWSYNLNSRLVFSVKPGEKRSAPKTLLKTYLSYGFSGIILNNLLGTLWIRGLGVSKYLSPFLNLLFTVPVNYLLNKFWAYSTKGFKKKKDEKNNPA